MCVFLIKDASESELENMLSENFYVTLGDMQVLIADKGNQR
jgi:predicted double-glycine peptidase